jgi:preprotein translocase subunit SecA
LQAVLREIKEIHETGRPILINTQTVQEADELSMHITKLLHIPCEILHARYHEDEANIIKSAGERGAVTVAAKMAGRGTDIKLSDEVANLGGLHVIGVERLDSRHHDRQLAGRAARQGQPGSVRFFLSLEDDLMRRFGRMEKIKKLMSVFSGEDAEPLSESRWLDKTIENAQRRLEKYAYEKRLEAYEFDSVLDKQRHRIYRIRKRALWGEDLREDIQIIFENIVARGLERYLPSAKQPANWNIDGLKKYFRNISRQFTEDSFVGIDKNRARTDIEARLLNVMQSIYERQQISLGGDTFASHKRDIIIRAIDQGWMLHLHRLNQLQWEMRLRPHMEENGLDWYNVKSNETFWEMIEWVEQRFAHVLFDHLPQIRPSLTVNPIPTLHPPQLSDTEEPRDEGEQS